MTTTDHTALDVTLAAEGDYDMKNEQWPYTCIDWAKAAEELQQDYTSVDFDGETYWVR